MKLTKDCYNAIYNEAQVLEHKSGSLARYNETTDKTEFSCDSGKTWTSAGVSFDEPEQWKIYKVKKWYEEDFEPNSIAVRVRDDENGEWSEIMTLDYYDVKKAYPFRVGYGAGYKYAKRATKQELLKLAEKTPNE